MPNLSNSWFQSNSTDVMLVEDAYKTSTDATKNVQYGSVKGIYNSAIEGLYTNKGSATTLLALVQQSKAGTISTTELLDRTLSAMGSSLPSLLGSIGGTLMANITGAAGTLFGAGAANTISVLYKNLPERLISTTKVTDYQDSSEFLREISGDSELMKLIHVEAESAVLGALAGELLSFGIPGMIDDAIANSSSETVRNNAYSFVSTQAVKGSDLVMVNHVIDNIGLPLFLEANPNAIEDILSMYYLGTDDTVNDYTTRRATLLQTLVRVNPTWDRVIRNNVPIPNLAPFVVASGDARTLLLMAEPERTMALAAPPYTYRSTNAVLTEMYPAAQFA